MNKLALLSSVKLPEYIRTEFPKLVAFVEAYYRYMETLTSIKNAGDIDSAEAMYVKLYKDSVARGFSDPEFLSTREFIYANKDFFSRKGTHDAFMFFFRAYFGEEITISTPDYMIASGGAASGDYFFYLDVEFGTIQTHDTLKLISQQNTARSGVLTSSTSSTTVTSTKSSFVKEDVGLRIYTNGKLLGTINEFVDTKTIKLTANANYTVSGVAFHLGGATTVQSLNVISTKLIDTNLYIVYFIPPAGFTSSIGDQVVVGDGTLTFKGSIRATPNKIVPVVGGTGWQRGQVFKLLSADGVTSTIIRVTKVTSTGGIEAMEILQYGYPIPSEQYSISSFQTSSDLTTDSSAYAQVVFDDGHYEETLTIHDNTGKTDDFSVVSIVTDGDANNYFSEVGVDMYMLEDYMGTMLSYEPYTMDNNSAQQSHTAEEWAASLATVRFTYGSYAKQKTSYNSDTSIISNQMTKIHDSLRYQAFAYAIQTVTDIRKYRGSIELLHPAGMHFSSTLNKEFNAVNTNVSITGSHSLPTMWGNIAQFTAGNVHVMRTYGITGNEFGSAVNSVIEGENPQALTSSSITGNVGLTTANRGFAVSESNATATVNATQTVARIVPVTYDVAAVIADDLTDAVIV